MRKGDGAFPWVVLGLTEALERRPVRRTTIAEFAAQLSNELERFAQRLAGDLGEVREAHLASWAEDHNDSGSLPDQNAVDALLERALHHAFDGVDLIMIMRGPGGGPYERISQAVLGAGEDNGLAGREQAYTASLLETAVEAASDLVQQYQLPGWFRKRYAGTGDMRPEAEYEELPLEAEGVAARFLRDNFGASEAGVEHHVREWACAQDTKKQPRRFGGRSSFMMLACGADGELQEILGLRRALKAAVKRLPPARRLEELLLTELDDTFMLALEMRSEALAQSPSDLVLRFGDGMRRLQDIGQRIANLGDAAGAASLLASFPGSVADFDAAEAAIERAIAAYEAAKAEPPASAEPRKSVRMSGSSRNPEQILHFSRETVRIALASGNARGHSVALAKLGNEVFKQRNSGTAASGECLREAIGCWQLALQGTWTPATASRKWAALTHNVGLAEICLGEIDASHEQIQAGFATIEKAAGSLDPKQHLWNHFAIRHTISLFSHLAAKRR